MTTSQFCRAKLVPFDAGGRSPQEARAIPLDFNPETLTLKVSGGEQRDRSRRGRQQVQNVGASKATLSFECIFDSTRPRDASGGDAGSEEMLDVRTRTKPIADLLQVYGRGREQAPRRVQFRWGTLIFNGVISQHQEVFDYFSPSGVPLRSKVTLTLTEQEFRYEVSATDAAQRRQAVEQATTGAGARNQAAAAGADRLMGGATGGGGFDLSAGFELSAGLNLDLNLDMSLSAQVGLSASLGLSADIGVAVGAGIALDASAAVDLFGPAALGTGADLGRSGVAIPQPSPGLAAAGVPPNPWAPDGPAPGSRAAGLAAVVSSQRAGGAVSANTAALTGGAARPPLPVRGSPPLATLRTPAAGAPLFAPRSTPTPAAAGERRPTWETLPAAGTTTVPRATATRCACGGCGCRRCTGG